MKVIWIGKKRAMANAKHFNNSKTEVEMDLLVLKVIKNATHVGVSDRSNGDYEPAKIIWGIYEDKTYAIVLDAKSISKNTVEIISFYDVHNVSHKAKRFNMKEVERS